MDSLGKEQLDRVVRSLPRDEVWSVEHEELLADWADCAACFSYAHSECQQRCRKRNIFMSLPVIILSTVSGTANFGMGSIFPETFTKANLVIGSMSLIT